MAALWPLETPTPFPMAVVLDSLVERRAPFVVVVLDPIAYPLR